MRAQVSLFSNDEGLIEFLRETVAETLGSDSALAVNPPGQARDSGLCIWDFFPGQTLVSRSIGTSEWRNELFLLYREDLGALKELIGTSAINVLLKPLTRSVLKAFLGGYNLRQITPDDEGRQIQALRWERDQVLQMLMRANLKLQELNQDRNNFLARSIHDFQAPLTAISGYCELLLGDELEHVTEGQRRVLQRMHQSVRRLTRATHSMSELSLADCSDTLDLEHGDIRECIDQALEELSAVLENRQVTVTVDVEPPPRDLWFDPARIEQVLFNLLESACKFTPRGGVIGVKGYPFYAERLGGRGGAGMGRLDRQSEVPRTVNSFRVDISDSGPMIPALEADRIFEEHTSYSGGQDRSGAGLGMATCRMILWQHRGYILAGSGVSGAVFSFVLPLEMDNFMTGRIGTCGSGENVYVSGK